MEGSDRWRFVAAVAAADGAGGVSAAAADHAALQTSPRRSQLLQIGLASSHFFRRARHVKQPVLQRVNLRFGFVRLLVFVVMVSRARLEAW
jgi:hypothetical protein